MVGVGRERARVILACAIGATLLVGLGATILWLPEKMVAWIGAGNDPQYAIIVDKFRSTLSQSIGGLLFLVGLYFTARNVFAAEQTRLTKTFSDAITQLGSVDKDGVPVIPVRLGGIYALERLSRDSPKDAYVICRILSQYVQVESNKWRETLKSKVDPPTLPDIEAALIVLGIIARGKQLRRGEALRFFDAFLPNLTLSGRSLGNFHFHRTVLAGSRLDNTDCTRAGFQACDLVSCSFANSRLVKCEFNKVEGRGIILSSVQGAQSTFLACDLREAEFVDSALEKCEFSDSDLSGSIFTRAKMVGAVISKTNVAGAVFDGADLSNADFRTAVGLTADQIAAARRQPAPSQLPTYLLVAEDADGIIQ